MHWIMRAMRYLPSHEFCDALILAVCICILLYAIGKWLS